MPTNKNAFTRYKILDELLSNRYRNYTLDDLTGEVNKQLAELSIEPVTRRCIEKDLAYLKGENSPFLADIESYSVDVSVDDKTVKKRCFRYADLSFSIFKKEMSDDEKYLLSQTLKLLGQFDGLTEFEELNRMRNGLQQDDRKIVSFTRNPLENSKLFGQLFTIIAHKQVIRLTYHKLSDLSKQNTILLHPYLLKEYNRRWDLFGASDSDDKLLHFSLDQIDKVEPLPAQPYKPSDDRLADFFDDIIGKTLLDNVRTEKIVFWVNDISKNYVITKPLHDSQILYKKESEAGLREQYPMLSGGAFFSIKCKENYELIRELSSFGSNLLVLSPAHIQNSVVERIEEMHEAYSKLRT